MMLRYSFNMTQEADSIEAAVNKVLDDGYRTATLSPRLQSGRNKGNGQAGC